MKRILFAILLSFTLICIYLLISTTIFLAYNENPKIIPYIDMPMRLPKLVYFYTYPPTKEDYSLEMSQRRIILSVSFFLVNVILYSIPIYFLFGLIAKFRKKDVETLNPPPLPNFNSSGF